MEQEDRLKEILAGTKANHIEIDMEAAIIGKIEGQASLARKVSMYKRWGTWGIAVSIVLFVLFLFGNKLVAALGASEHIYTQIFFSALCLLLLFLQLEFGKRPWGTFKTKANV